MTTTSGMELKTCMSGLFLMTKGGSWLSPRTNCDNGDGWEREGEDDGFFHEFSEKRAYPLGINIIFYLMTH